MSVENYDDFLKYYIKPVDQISSQCIEELHTLFYLFRNEIWTLSPKLMTHFAPVVFNLYTATANSVYYLKSKLEDLVFLILFHFSDSKDHLKLILFSQCQINVEYDDGDGNIKIKYTEREHQLDLEIQVDLVLNLIEKRSDPKLMKTMFITLLDMYKDVLLNKHSVMEKLFIVKAIHHLIEKEDVQKSISKDQENVLNLIKSILKEISEDNIVDIQVLSITLLVLGCILENIDKKYINQLEGFEDDLATISETIEDKVFKDMVLKMKQKIKQIQGDSLKQQPASNKRTIDDVLFDTRDPLLPCRSHALIELKKMIESGDKEIMVKKTAILIVIQVCIYDLFIKYNVNIF